jgi:hypothetical protein
VPNNNGEFAARVAALQERIAALQARLAATQEKQTSYLAQLAIHELDGQKTRLAAYQVQARFALATMYDRAANQEETKGEKGAALPKGLSKEDEAPQDNNTPGQDPTLKPVDPGAAPSSDDRAPEQGAATPPPPDNSGQPAPPGAATPEPAPAPQGAAPTPQAAAKQEAPKP